MSNSIEKTVHALPELEIDTQVLVKQVKDEYWTTRHFRKWSKAGNMLCFDDGRTSFTAIEDRYSAWKYWKVIDGKFISENNCK